MVAAEQAAHEAAQRGLDRGLAAARRLRRGVLRGLQTAVDGARQLGHPARPRAGRDAVGPADWAVRAIVGRPRRPELDDLGPARRGRGPDRPPPQQAVQTLGFRQVVIGDAAPGTATARLALVAPLREHLAEGGRLRGTFKSGVQRDAEAVLDHATRGRPARSTTRRARRPGLRGAGGAGLRRDPGPRLGAWSGVVADRPMPPSRCSSRSPGSSTRTRGSIWCSGSWPRSGAVRQTLAAAQSWLPLTRPRRLAGVRRRARRRAAAGRGRAGLGRPRRDRRAAAPLDGAPAATRRRSWPRRRRPWPTATRRRTRRRWPRWPTPPRRAGRPGRLRRARDAAARGPPRAGRADGRDRGRPGLAGPARRLGRRVGLGPGEHVLRQPAPARPGAAARGRAVRHHHPAAPGDRRSSPRRGPGDTACGG